MSFYKIGRSVIRKKAALPYTGEVDYAFFEVLVCTLILIRMLQTYLKFNNKKGPDVLLKHTGPEDFQSAIGTYQIIFIW